MSNQPSTELPGRERQLAQLRNVQRLAGLIASAFVFGPAATGKTAAVQLVFGLESIVDCNRAFTLPLVLSAMAAILFGPSSHIPDLASLAFACRLLSTPKVVVFDGAEKLRGLAENRVRLVSALLRLPNVTCVFVAALPWRQFQADAEESNQINIYFNAYSYAETRVILERDCPADEDDLAFYLRFVDLTQSVLHRACRDLNELRHIVALLFPKYKDPVIHGKCTKDIKDSKLLYDAVQFYFKEVIDKLYIRKVSSSEWTQASTSVKPFSNAQTLKALDTFDIDLPYNTTYLLLASFIASYNPKGLDVRFFARANEKRTRKTGISMAKKTSAKLRQQLVGPKPFPIERMLAIFYRIKEDTSSTVDELESLVDIQMQITSLVAKGLLIRMSAAGRIEEVKCKVNIGMETAFALAGRVRLIGYSWLDLLCDLFATVVAVAVIARHIGWDFADTNYMTVMSMFRSSLVASTNIAIMVTGAHWPDSFWLNMAWAIQTYVLCRCLNAEIVLPEMKKTVTQLATPSSKNKAVLANEVKKSSSTSSGLLPMDTGAIVHNHRSASTHNLGNSQTALRTCPDISVLVRNRSMLGKD
ncbi:Origin recognition complex subunit 5 [Rhizoclosmatium sp. JEL0117]|nr:Origin recognition complex subunit 5 [Rhizoclosmatium sp. JEL0117]